MDVQETSIECTLAARQQTAECVPFDLNSSNMTYGWLGAICERSNAWYRLLRKFVQLKPLKIWLNSHAYRFLKYIEELSENGPTLVCLSCQDRVGTLKSECSAFAEGKQLSRTILANFLDRSPEPNNDVDHENSRRLKSLWSTTTQSQIVPPRPV